MARETVTGASIVFLGRLEVGQETSGYLKTIELKNNKFGGVTPMMMMVGRDGREFPICPSGTALWTAKNIAAHLKLCSAPPDRASELERDAKLLGHYIYITRQPGIYHCKKTQKDLKTYLFERDSEDKLENPKVAPVTTHAPTSSEVASSEEEIPF